MPRDLKKNQDKNEPSKSIFCQILTESAKIHLKMTVTPEKTEFSEFVDEFSGFIDGVLDRLPEYVHRAATLPPGAYGSVEWSIRAGRFLEGMRRETGLTRTQVAANMGVNPNLVRYLEQGMATLPEYQGDLPKRFVEGIGQPAVHRLYDLMFHLEFGVDTQPTPRPTKQPQSFFGGIGRIIRSLAA